MKKLLPLTFLIFLFSSSFSQLCTGEIKIGGIDGSTAFTNVRVLEIDPAGAVWFDLWSMYGGRGFGMVSESDTLMFHDSTNLERYLHPTVNAIAFDKNDSVWVGTERGLGHFNGVDTAGWEIYKTANSDIPGDKITAIQVDASNVKWIVTNTGEEFNKGKLVSFYNGVWDSIRFFDQKINDIAIDQQGGVWVAKNGTPGLTRYYDSSWTDFNEFTNIQYITADHLNRILVSAGDSLVVLLNNNIINVVKGRSDWNLVLYDIAVGPGGRVWVSSNQGFLLKSGQRFCRFNQYNSPMQSGQGPIPLEIDAEDNLWYSYIYYQGGAPFPGIGYVYKSVEDVEKIAVTNVNAVDGSSAQPVSNFPVAAFCYGESVEMNATETATAYIWNEDGTATESSFVAYDSDTIAMAYKAPDNCYYYDTIRVIAQKVFRDEEICVVTISLDTHNLVVFEKTPDVGTEFYYLYKEVRTGVFEHIAQLPATNLSVFVDETSDPRVQSYKYKITSVDTCQNESDVAETFFHKTMHLLFDQDNGNLTWQNYEGRYVPYYSIFKGNTPNDLIEVAQVPADDVNLTWKDVNVTGIHYYQVGVELDSDCRPNRNVGKKADSGPYSHSLSNIEDNRLQIESISKLGAVQLNAWPNPFSEYTNIQFENPDNSYYELIIMDISGKVVRKLGGITDSKITLERNELPSGFYTFDLRGENRYVGKFIIE